LGRAGLACLATLGLLPAIAHADPVRIPPTIDSARCKMPEYPPISQTLGEQGPVVLRLLVAPNGVVIRGEVGASSGFQRLDQAALDALSECRFNPAMIDGKPDPQPNWKVMRYVWKLETPAEGAGVAPREHSWYSLAANKDQMIVVDQNSAAPKGDAISYVESRITYNLTRLDNVETPVRRIDTLHWIDCKQNKWRATWLIAFGDDGKPIAKAQSDSPDKEEWAPITAGSSEEAAVRLFCQGHIDHRLVSKDKDINQVQQSYLRAAQQYQ
jgi:TonB family protein